MPATLSRQSVLARQQRVELGDWQTPAGLAREVVALVARTEQRFGAVLEPTCGRGAFLLAAARAFPESKLVGFDRNGEYVAAARAALAGTGAALGVSDFFARDWRALIAELPGPLLLLGNPPWVTSSTLGVLDGTNTPAKSNFKRQAGYDALTGKSNFDISESILLCLIEAALARPFTLAMLCKATVARRIMERSAALAWPLEGAVYAVDARAHFSAAVAAVLLVVRRDAPGVVRASSEARWGVYESLAATSPRTHMGVSAARAYSDYEGYRATEALAGLSELTWRSGVKHDLARVMELVETGGGLENGLGERVVLEPDYLYPLCKGSALDRGSSPQRRFVLVTQQKLGDDTAVIRERAPLTFRYLERHRALFDARKSRIYRGQPPFAMFGVGDYTFAPYKVAISALHKRLTFRVLEPSAGRPVLLDDTAYFLACSSAEQARSLCAALSSQSARAFFEARIFWDAMRPINKALLGALSLEALLQRLGQLSTTPQK